MDEEVESYVTMVADGLMKGLTGEIHRQFHARFETTNEWEC